LIYCLVKIEIRVFGMLAEACSMVCSTSYEGSGASWMPPEFFMVHGRVEFSYH
jgi:hypothetical protein